MRAKPCGSFALLLMSAPLAAIPLMAAFGVPQFTPVSASTAPSESATDDVVREPSPAVAVDNQPPSSSPAHEVGASTRISFGTDAPQSSHFRRPNAPFTSLGSTSTLSGHATQEDRSSGKASSPSAVLTDQTWHSAAGRLREMGIDDYRLERGNRNDSFLFICQFAPGGDHRIVQRFEAEAAAPMAAVQQVITQIDHWRQWTSPVSERNN
ncbi:MAG: hypothetical protein AB7U20_08120 [Planctomycetaceae bacterium]